VCVGGGGVAGHVAQKQLATLRQEVSGGDVYLVFECRGQVHV
jgi:hypothetical protein